MYAEYKNVPVHGVQGCMQSTGNVHGVRDSISLYVEYKLSMHYDTKSPKPYDDLYDVTESLQPYIHTSIHISICNPVSVYTVLIELIIPGGLENLHSTTPPNHP